MLLCPLTLFFRPDGGTYYDRLVILVTVPARGTGRPRWARGTGRASRRAGRASIGAGGAVAARRAAVHVPAGRSAGWAAGPHAPGLSVGSLGAVVVRVGPVVAGAAGPVPGTRRLEKKTLLDKALCSTYGVGCIRIFVLNSILSLRQF